jgi:hypothetical protein
MLKSASTLRRALRLTLVIVPLALSLAACDSASVEGTEYAFGFRLAPAAGSLTSPASGVTTGGDELVITGDNGTLNVSAIRFVVGEFELESDASCEYDDDDGGDLSGGDGEDDDGDDFEECEFELPPAFLSLPLDGAFTPIGDAVIPAGTYDEFEFEVENLDLDDDGDDDDDRAELQRVISEVRAQYPIWPDGAGAVIEGSFTPTGGSARSFQVFARAEVEVEREFDPPLVVTADGRREAIVVRVNPAAWFLTGEGDVVDLSEFDFATTGELIEVDLEDGFLDVEEDDEAHD